MDALKLALDWAKAEMFSSSFFVLAGILFLSASLGFWKMGKTELARAFTTPLLVVGALLLIIGLGLFFTNKSRAARFPAAHQADPAAFVASEIERAEKTLAEFRNVVFKAIPAIVVVAALLIAFVDKPVWRAASMATIAMMAVIWLVDSNAAARIEAYKADLERIEAPNRE